MVIPHVYKRQYHLFSDIVFNVHGVLRDLHTVQGTVCFVIDRITDVVSLILINLGETSSKGSDFENYYNS